MQNSVRNLLLCHKIEEIQIQGNTPYSFFCVILLKKQPAKKQAVKSKYYCACLNFKGL